MIPVRSKFDTTTYEEIDVLWTDRRWPVVREDCRAIAFMQHEPTFSTFVSGMGAIGNREPIARIYSRHLCVEPFNHIPEVMEPCWMLYDIDGTLLLRLTNWMPPVSPDDTTNWLFSYPAIRDMTCLLIDLGVTSLGMLTTLLTTDTPLDPLDDNGAVIVYDFMNDTMLGGLNLLGGGELALTTPCWLFNYLFSKIMAHYDGDAESYLCVVKTDTTGLDENAIQHFVDYYQQVYGIECDLEEMNKVRSLLISIDEDGNFTSPFDIDPNDSGGYHI